MDKIKVEKKKGNKIKKRQTIDLSQPLRHQFKEDHLGGEWSAHGLLRFVHQQVIVSHHIVVVEGLLLGEVVRGDGQAGRQRQALPVHSCRGGPQVVTTTSTHRHQTLLHDFTMLHTLKCIVVLYPLLLLSCFKTTTSLRKALG
ncbi:hypothetical protein E2C01_014450 [Portunus trituberculatus]|uniref:Uncharacterized protein n=1 Tax=Portunus trituberculatus TaxID=210409 RepID=A0A5B7DK50_PORTR|nr:hypothetical protein [Portunus trituberculatus]